MSTSPEFFRITVTEEHGGSEWWPSWLTSCGGTLTLSTFVPEFQSTVPFSEAFQIFHDRLLLRLVMGARSETPNSSVVTTHATDDQIHFYARFTDAITIFQENLGNTKRQQKLFDMFKCKIDRFDEFRDLSAELLYNPPMISVSKIISEKPTKQMLVLSELLTVPFCLVPSLEYFDRLATLVNWVARGNDVVENREVPGDLQYPTTIVYQRNVKPKMSMTARLNSDVPKDIAPCLLHIVSMFHSYEGPWIDEAVRDPKNGRVHVHWSYLSELERVKFHREGAVMPIPPWKRTVALLYLLTSIGVSISTGALDFAGRDNWFEQAFDSISVISLLLFTVVGLVKLTSEDPNVIRNMILGQRILRSHDDLVKALGLRNLNQLKLVIAHPENKALTWLDPVECSYAAVKGTGFIPVRGGLPLTELKKMGAVVISNRLFRRMTDETGELVRMDADGLINIQQGSRGKIGPDYELVPVDKIVK